MASGDIDWEASFEFIRDNFRIWQDKDLKYVRVLDHEATIREFNWGEEWDLIQEMLIRKPKTVVEDILS